MGGPPLTDPAAEAGQRLVPRVFRLFLPYRVHVAIVVFFILWTSCLGVVNPMLIQVVFDDGLGVSSDSGPNIRLLWILGGVMIAIASVNAAMGIFQTYMTNKVGQYVMRDLRDAVYSHLQGMSLRFFTGTRTGEIQSRVSNDVGGIQQVVTTTLSDTIANIAILASTLGAMVFLSWQLTLVAIATVPLYFFMAQWVGRKRREITSQTQKSMAEMTVITQETLSVSGIMLAKLFGRQHEEMANFRRHNQELSDLTVRQQMIGHAFFAVEMANFRRHNQELSDLTVRQQMIGHAFFAVVMAFLSVSPVAIYLLAGYMMSGGGPSVVSAGTVIAFTVLQNRLYFPVGRLLQVSVELQSSLAMFERIFGYLDLKQEIVDSPDARPLPAEGVTGEITFDSVRVNYRRGPGGEEEDADDGLQGRQWALDGVSIRIPPGRMAAFVGPSGAGKSTIASLVPRLYDVTEGAVCIDGIDVRKIKLADLSEIIGYVTQESYLFHASMERNLLYARPDATCHELVAAAKAAYIHDRIMELPEGYNTIVGERGFRLSGGERQRLAIARVILHQPRILILDEATSSLDTASERYVQSALEPLMQGRTTLVVAHRLSTIMSADVIYVIDKGRVVEQGSHAELLSHEGLYAHLYREQYGSGLIEAYCEDGVIYSDGRIVPTDTSAPILTSRR
jgi:ATP-binding cassette subfamily B protein